MNTPLFDRYIMVDWSASPKPARGPGADALWIGWIDADTDGDERCGCLPANAEHFPTRRAVLNRVVDLARSRNALVGFDFAFGFPYSDQSIHSGVRLLEDLHSRTFSASTERCRFEVAAEYNRAIGLSEGPFWCAGSGGYAALAAKLPMKKPGFEEPLREFRRVERKASAKGAKSVWQLTGPGAVGSQAINGLAWVAILRQELECDVWPFESTGKASKIVEIYPTLHLREYSQIASPLPAYLIKDAAQVIGTAAWFKHLDAAGELESDLLLTHLTDDERKSAAREGWILGVR